jgi:hypothetical protein
LREKREYRWQSLGREEKRMIIRKVGREQRGMKKLISNGNGDVEAFTVQHIS